VSVAEPLTGTRLRPSRDAPRDVAGAGLAILVNANAKRGGRRIAAQIARAMPAANVRLTRTPDEVDAWLRGLRAPRCILAAGGDGTIIALVNALRRVHGDAPFPPIGVLPLGTGNAWAHSTGAPKLHESIQRAAESRGPLVVRSFGLVECEDTLTHFAGCGWDAQVLDDYKKQLAQSKGPSKWVSKSVYGYVTAMISRTAPKSILFGRPRVIIENLGDEVYTITADRKLLKINGAKLGTVLYDGPMSVAGSATSPDLGYKFRAYPFAERLPGMMNVRVYDQSTIRAILSIPDIWSGKHPLEGMHDWFATAVRMTFSRTIPLQIGGDAVGSRQTVEYRVSERRVDLLDWRALD
jgi:diacylglycerol kinase family enzyme